MLRRTFVLGALAVPLTTAQTASAAAAALPMPALDAQGFYVADWMHHTSGDVAQDLARATGAGKVLAMFWEMSPCPYCTLMHTALRDPTLREHVAERMYSVRYDKLGTQAIVDFNGAHRTQREMGLAHRVVGSPTIVFRTAGGREVGRMPGYVNAAGLRATFEFVSEGHYQRMSLSNWLRIKGAL
jgi:thioredoxin-related protein